MWREVVDQVLGHVSGLGEYEWFWSVCGFDGEDGGFAEGVHVLEFRGCEHVLAFVGLDGVVYFGFFEEPDDALGAGLFEPIYFSLEAWLWMIWGIMRIRDYVVSRVCFYIGGETFCILRQEGSQNGGEI